MSEPFIAEIRIFAGNFAPRDWAFCDGQLLAISQNTALFSLVGTTYGGDGRTTFGLPNLKGRTPMHPGSGPGLSQRRLGETGGTATVALSSAQMPAHGHALMGSEDPASSSSPGGNYPAVAREDAYASGGTPVAMASGSIGSAGVGQPHNNLQPYLVINFIIALFGIYPSRS